MTLRRFASAQFWQAGFPLQRGHSYALQFWAKADGGELFSDA
jgi:hypothetical protein